MKNLFLFAFISILVVIACKKKTSTPDPDPTPTTTGATTPPPIDVNSQSQASFTFGGNNYTYVVNGTSYFSGSGTSGGTRYSYDSGIDNGDTVNYFNITKGSIATPMGGAPSDSTFKTFFPIASVPYTTNVATGNGVGVTIWINHVRWSTSLGNGNQSGSAFNIIQKKEDQQGYLYMKTYCTYSCNLYNTAGVMKPLTNGKYVGFFGNF